MSGVLPYERLFIRGLNGVRRHLLKWWRIPILGIQGEFLGAVALFLGAWSIMRVTLYRNSRLYTCAWT